MRSAPRCSQASSQITYRRCALAFFIWALVNFVNFPRSIISHFALRLYDISERLGAPGLSGPSPLYVSAPCGVVWVCLGGSRVLGYFFCIAAALPFRDALFADFARRLFSSLRTNGLREPV